MTTPHLNPDTMAINRPSVISKEKVFNEEQILSQKLNQLSPFKNNQQEKELNINSIQPQTTMSSTEFTFPKSIGMDFNSIPDYLSTKNQSFENKIACILPSTIHLEELRDIAIVMHKIMSIEIVQSLWIVYRKSGMGELYCTLPINQSDRKIWPKEVQSLVKQQLLSQMEKNVNEDDTYLNFVNHCLHELNKKSQQYRHELNVKTSCLSGYNHSLEYTIEKFIQQGLQSLRIEIDQQTALVQYHYSDEILKRLYLAQNPNENQIQLIKRLGRLKYNQEMAKHEVELLKEKLSLHITSHPFERESIAKSSLIDSIHNSRLRQQLYKQYKNIAEEARNNMMSVYMESAAEQKQQCQEQYDIVIKEMWNLEKNRPSNQQLTKAMRDLIEQRLNNISAHIECIYKFKTQLFRLNSNIH